MQLRRLGADSLIAFVDKLIVQAKKYPFSSENAYRRLLFSYSRQHVPQFKMFFLPYFFYNIKINNHILKQGLLLSF